MPVGSRSDTHIVHITRWHPEAVTDLESVKGKDERKATFNVVDKLVKLGGELIPPHMKKMKGEPDWCELRPSSGKSALRPIYCQEGVEFVIYAVAIEPNKADFDTALSRAKARRDADRKATTSAQRPVAPSPAPGTVFKKRHHGR